MSEDNIIENWLDTMVQKQDEYKHKKEEHLLGFLDFTHKTPQQIIDENKTQQKRV